MSEENQTPEDELSPEEQQGEQPNPGDPETREEGQGVDEQLDALLDGDEVDIHDIYEAYQVCETRKHLNRVAAAMDLQIPVRATIKEVRSRIEEMLKANDPDRQPPEIPEEQEPAPKDVKGKLPKGYRGSNRRLRNKKTKRELVWTPALARHPDMEEVEAE